jgi:hypothetical protein
MSILFEFDLKIYFIVLNFIVYYLFAWQCWFSHCSANILVGVKGEAKLADFGCSKSIQGLVSQDLNTMQGTPYVFALKWRVIVHSSELLGFGWPQR